MTGFGKVMFRPGSSHLVTEGYLIHFVADTLAHQQGIDITAEKDGHLWVSVKGYPKGTEKTKPSVQAGHWFKEIIFDMVEYRGRNEGAQLVAALPDFTRYHNLATKVAWFRQAVEYLYYWVNVSGHVTVE